MLLVSFCLGWASLCAGTGCRPDSLEPSPPSASPPSAPPPPTFAVGRADTLFPTADTYIASETPDLNRGTADSLEVRAFTSGHLHTGFLAFDQAAIAARVGTGTVDSAKLELSIRLVANWPTSGSRLLLYVITKPQNRWTETGATWNCPIDVQPQNAVLDCPGGVWDTAGFGVQTPTAQPTIKNSTTGTLKLTVTTDVRAFLGGQANLGWYLTKSTLNNDQTIVFRSRESTTKPRLVLWTTPADTSRPATPPELVIQGGDPTKIVTWPGAVSGEPGSDYFRTVFSVQFKDGTSGTTIREVLARYQAQVIGGSSGFGIYKIQVPDPGATYNEYNAFYNRLSAEPSIEYVEAIATAPDIRNDARYPDDGASFGRQDWLMQGQATWPWRAIRAPLAWGCETGLYGDPSARASVAVLESFVSPTTSNADLGGSRIAPPVYPAVSTSFGSLSSFVRDVYAAHAVKVAGQLTAAGNNGQGLAGVLWSSRLLELSLADDQGLRGDIPAILRSVVRPALKQRGVRVLNISSESYQRDTTKQKIAAAATEKAFRVLLDSLPNLTIIKAQGNDRQTLDYTETTRLRELGLFSYALSQLKHEDARYASRIIFVGGTTQGNAYWDGGPTMGSSFVHGTTEILAPAGPMKVLNLPGFPQSDSGTSFAAPMVAGVAGALLTMDPTLVPAQVKDYILRGASQVRRENANTGAMELPVPVSGAPETIYQLDAYGSLQLLSRERPGTPICGLEVVAENAPGTNTLRSVIQRDSPEPIAPGGQGVVVTSIAQGGRLVARDSTLYRLSAGGWTSAGIAPGSVAFLEQDTAYFRSIQSQNGYRSDLWLQIASEDPTRRVAGQVVTNGLPSSPGGLFGYAYYDRGHESISPTGDWLYVGWSDSYNDDCYHGQAAYGQELYLLFPLRGGGRQTLASRSWANPPCSTPIEQYPPPADGPLGGIVGWRADGEQFYWAEEERVSAVESVHLDRYTLQSGLPQRLAVTPTGVATFPALQWTPEGGRLRSAERISGGSCFIRVRAASVPGQVLSETPVADPNLCFTPRIAPARGSFLALEGRSRADGAPQHASRGTARGASSDGAPRPLRVN